MKICAAASTKRAARSTSSRCARSSRRLKTPTSRSLSRRRAQLIAEAEVGHEIEFPKPTDILGRIAAQTAKQVIFQKVREAERDNVLCRVLRSRRRGHQRNHQAPGDGRLHRLHGARRSPVASQGAEPGRGLPVGRPRPRRQCAFSSPPRVRRSCGQPHRSGASHEAVRDGGPRDLRRHGRDQGMCARGR